MAVTDINAPVYQSQYVPANLDVYGQALQAMNQRYETAFLRDHEIGSRLSTVANQINPEDRALFMEQTEDLRNRLAQRSADNNYENMGMDTAKDAMEFARGVEVFADAKASKDKWLNEVANSNWDSNYKRKLIEIQGNAPSVVKDEITGQLVNRFGSGLQFEQDANVAEKAQKYAAGFNADSISSTRESLITLQGDSKKALALRNATDEQVREVLEGIPVKVRVGNETVWLNPKDVASSLKTQLLADSDIRKARDQRVRFLMHDDPSLSQEQAIALADSMYLDDAVNAMGSKLGFKKSASTFMLQPDYQAGAILAAKNKEKMVNDYVRDIVMTEGFVSNIEKTGPDGVPVKGARIESVEDRFDQMTSGRKYPVPKKDAIVGATTAETMEETLPEDLYNAIIDLERTDAPDVLFETFERLAEMHDIAFNGHEGQIAQNQVRKAWDKLPNHLKRAFENYMPTVRNRTTAVQREVFDASYRASIESVNSITGSNFKYKPEDIYTTNKDGSISYNHDAIADMGKRLDETYKKFADSRKSIANYTFADSEGKFEETYSLNDKKFPTSTSFYVSRNKIGSGNDITEGTMTVGEIKERLPEGSKYKGAQAIGVSAINGGDNYLGTSYELIFDNPSGEKRVRVTGKADAKLQATNTYEGYKNMMDVSKTIPAPGAKFQMFQNHPGLEFEVIQNPAGPLFKIYKDGEAVNLISRDALMKNTGSMVANMMLDPRGTNRYTKTDASAKVLETSVSNNSYQNLDAKFLNMLFAPKVKN